MASTSVSDSSVMVASTCNSDYHTAPALETELITTTSSSAFQERSESGDRTSIEQVIEQSKSHWSQVVDFDSDNEELAEVSNVEVFKRLQMHSTHGTFFRTFGEGELVVGKKFAEGGQAELYEAEVTWEGHDGFNAPKGRDRFQWVLKVFKKGTFLRHLQSQWPQGMLQFHAQRETTAKRTKRYNCDVYRGTLLKDGRFAFLMQKEHKDLRSVIDCNMSLRIGQERGPFSQGIAEMIMYHVALGMDWLHSHNIVHRDLKASNVLVRIYGEDYYECFVADYECSIGVIGTGFWRAPEILQACKDGNVSQRHELFTKEADIYSYGMTCYEILTGKFPFEGHSWRNYDLVLNGHHLEIPKYVDSWAHKLLTRCLHSNPLARPSFKDILNMLVVKLFTCS